VALNGIIPNAALTNVTVRGLEDEDGFAGNWRITGAAICTTPPGLERVVAASPNDSLNKSVTATCPNGKRVLGAGGEISGGGRQVTLNDLIPGSSQKSVIVQGFEDEDGTSSNWQVRAFAICAKPVGGLERVVATSSTDSSLEKSVVVSCPTGKQVVGAGAELGGGGGEVVLNEIAPTDDELTSVTVRGLEDEDGTASNWFVRGFANCAASSELAVAQGPNDSSAKNQAVSCPAGKQVTGGGGDITGGGGQVVLDELRPFATGFRVTAFEDETGISSNWFLRAYAICATPLPGQELVFAASPSTSSTKSVTAACPPGKRLIGAGGDVNAGSGEVMLTGIAPNPALTGVTATAFEDQTGVPTNWTVSAFAVCATMPPGLELASATTERDSDISASVAATCPGDKNLLGMGAELIDVEGQVMLDDLRPNAALTTVTATGFEDESGTGSGWSLRAHAICANP
jgi:hypothetical protein